MFCYVIGRKSLDNATLYDKLFFVVLAVGVDQCLFIILVEELLVSKRLDLIIDPVEQAFVALGDSGSDGIVRTELRDTDGVAVNSVRVCDDLGVVVCPSNALTVLKGGLCV